jgi:hypothetical protein
MLRKLGSWTDSQVAKSWGKINLEFCGPSGRVVTSEYSSGQANIAGKKINWLLDYDTLITEEPNEKYRFCKT